MKKRINPIRSILAAAILIFTAVFAYTTTIAADYETWYVGASSGLNCRAEPTTAADILTVYPTHTALQIIGVDSTGAWWQSWDGTTQGWVHSDYMVSDPNETPSVGGTYLGTFKITHFCPCYICNGSYGNHTAWAGEIIPGQTIAVDPSVIGKLQWVYIEGYGLRRAEDCGGGIKGNRIDIAVPTHQMALELGVVYKAVYLAE